MNQSKFVVIDSRNNKIVKELIWAKDKAQADSQVNRMNLFNGGRNYYAKEIAK